MRDSVATLLAALVAVIVAAMGVVAVPPCRFACPQGYGPTRSVSGVPVIASKITIF